MPEDEFPEAANEIIHLRVGQNGPYGEPLWIGNAPGVIGARKSEELNVEYFDNGRMLACFNRNQRGTDTGFNRSLEKSERQFLARRNSCSGSYRLREGDRC
ncbi:phage-like element pbsx protein xkde [Paenibacillus alvei TS-15]|uniref:Phage-like element pbsx protein xkde n=1 Tax=Paenibacillus alvei TS-15 TaxID=1117108 RepID=S9SU55_PAEAL|nr:phage-like element pbsx protein xkde [Paenibacillus alvei TS-15]